MPGRNREDFPGGRAMIIPQSLQAAFRSGPPVFRSWENILSFASGSLDKTLEFCGWEQRQGRAAAAALACHDPVTASAS
jgi:hypothetical protein